LLNELPPIELRPNDALKGTKRTMHKRLATSLLAAVTLFLASTGFSNTASAGFEVRIDGPSGGYPSWGGSGNQITLEAKINNAWTFIHTFYAPSDPWCPSDWCVGMGGWPWGAQDVQALRLTTDGTDTFWLDRLMLLDLSGNLVSYWGDDGDYIGDCFSRDSNDGRNAYCWNNRAYRSITYNR
jgi:hypothetical protein